MKTMDFHKDRNICFFTSTRVTSVDLDHKVVVTDRGHELNYTCLLVATGGTPNRLTVPGADADGVCYFQTLDDTEDLSQRIANATAGVVIGGSYIAYELAEAFQSRGVPEITWLIRGPRFLHRVLDEDGGALVDAIARRHRVRMVYEDSADHLESKNGRAVAVVSAKSCRFSADIVGCGLGLKYNHDFLPPGRVDITYGILTNEYLETNLTDVYAAGDIAEFYDVDLDTHYTMGTWASATTHGRVAAANMAGDRQPVRDIRAYTTTLFDSRMTVLGATPETHPEIESVSHTEFAGPNPSDWSYRRLFFFDDRLVGAALIGDMRPKIELVKVIRSKRAAWDERAALLRL
jgi:NAD(P)H-nitrite reductase large subunit